MSRGLLVDHWYMPTNQEIGCSNHPGRARGSGDSAPRQPDPSVVFVVLLGARLKNKVSAARNGPLTHVWHLPDTVG